MLLLKGIIDKVSSYVASYKITGNKEVVITLTNCMENVMNMEILIFSITGKERFNITDHERSTTRNDLFRLTYNCKHLFRQTIRLPNN